MSDQLSHVMQSQSKTEIRFGGFGGQGIVLAGRLLGIAASIYDGKEAVFTQAYGPEARGGASNADIIIDNAPVDYPYVTQPDVLVVLFQEACNKFQSELKTGGILIVEESLVTPAEMTEQDKLSSQVYRIPATKMAIELGNKIVMNVIVLGFLVGLTNVVSRAAVEQAIRASVKPKVVEINLQAFSLGYEYASQMKKEKGGSRRTDAVNSELDATDHNIDRRSS